MKRPLTLTIVVILQWLAAGLALIASVDLIGAAFRLRDETIVNQLEGALLNQGIVDVPGSALVTAVFVAGVLLAAIAVLRAVVAVFLARGRAWARTVVTVLVGLTIVSSLAYLFEGYWVRAVTTVALESVVLWLLYDGRTSAFIRQQPARSA